MSSQVARQWREVEIPLTGPQVSDPYLGVEIVVDFVHESGETITRPAFWDGGRTWRVRFASTRPEGLWRWTAHGGKGVTPRPDSWSPPRRSLVVMRCSSTDS